MSRAVMIDGKIYGAPRGGIAKQVVMTVAQVVRIEIRRRPTTGNPVVGFSVTVPSTK